MVLGEVESPLPCLHLPRHPRKAMYIQGIEVNFTISISDHILDVCKSPTGT